MSEAIILSKDITTLTTEIRTITRQTQQLILTAAIEIGRRLVEAKELVPHGAWGDYLRNEVEFSQSTANNFMAVYKEYGNQQQNLFGSNSQALGNLPYTKALRLLALPVEEREEFLEEHNVDSMSTRELEKALKDLEQAQAERDKANAQMEQAQRDLENSKQAMAEMIAMEQAMADMAESEKKAKADAEKLEKALADAMAKEKDLQDEMKRLKEHPEIPAAQMAKLRKEAEAAAVEKTRKELEGELAKAKSVAATAQREKADMEAKLQAAQKAVQLSDPNAAVFESLFSSVQDTFNRMNGALLKVTTNDPALGEKLKKATLALLDKFREGL